MFPTDLMTLYGKTEFTAYEMCVLFLEQAARIVKLEADIEQLQTDVCEEVAELKVQNDAEIVKLKQSFAAERAQIESFFDL